MSSCLCNKIIRWTYRCAGHRRCKKRDVLSSGITKPMRQACTCATAAHLCTSGQRGGQHLKVFNLQRRVSSNINEHAESMKHA